MNSYGRIKRKCPACNRPFIPGVVCAHIRGADELDQIVLGERSHLLPDETSPNAELAEVGA